MAPRIRKPFCSQSLSSQLDGQAGRLQLQLQLNKLPRLVLHASCNYVVEEWCLMQSLEGRFDFVDLLNDRTILNHMTHCLPTTHEVRTSLVICHVYQMPLMPLPCMGKLPIQAIHVSLGFKTVDAALKLSSSQSRKVIMSCSEPCSRPPIN